MAKFSKKFLWVFFIVFLGSWLVGIDFAAAGAKAPTLVQTAFRWRNNDGGETTASWRQNESINDTQAKGTNIRLRIAWAETAGAADSGNTDIIPLLEYKLASGGACTDATGWTTMTTVSTAFQLVDSTYFTDKTATTQQLTGGTPGWLAGEMLDQSNPGTTLTMSKKETEHEYNFKATASASEAAYIFRMSRNGTGFNTYTKCPQLTVVANAAPTLVVNEPNGSGDTIAEGANFTVNYTLSDAYDVVTANFAYDTDNADYNGTLISTCVNRPEASPGTCIWSTTGVAPGNYYVHGTTTDNYNAEVQVYSSGYMTINDAPTIEVTDPDGVGDTVTQGDNYTIDYDLADTDDTVTANFAYDADAADYNGTLITSCVNKAAGIGATCVWNTTGVPAGDYYIHGTSTDGINAEAQDYSSNVVTILSGYTGVFDVTASSSESFNSGVAIPFQFTSQTTTVDKAGALKIEDDRGTNAGWDVNLGATDWKSGEDVMQLDYAGTGSDDNLGKLCAFPAEAAISAETGSITGVTVGSADACFSSGITSITVASATATNGNGAYWLTDMKLEQFIPFSPTAQEYTTTIYYTLISR